MKLWQKFLLLIGLFAGSEALYQLFLYLECTYFPKTPVCTLVLGIAVSGLLIAVVVLNRGFDARDVTPEQLSSTLPHEKRVQLCEKLNKQKKTAKTLMYIFIPLALVFSVDILDLYFDIFDKIKGLFG